MVKPKIVTGMVTLCRHMGLVKILHSTNWQKIVTMSITGRHHWTFEIEL